MGYIVLAGVRGCPQCIVGTVDVLTLTCAVGKVCLVIEGLLAGDLLFADLSQIGERQVIAADITDVRGAGLYTAPPVIVIEPVVVAKGLVGAVVVALGQIAIGSHFRLIEVDLIVGTGILILSVVNLHDLSVGVFLLQLFQLAISGCSVIVFASGPVVFILIESIGNRTGDLVELAGRWITVDLSGVPGLGIGIPVFVIIIPARTGVLVVAIAAALFVVEGDAVDQADLVVILALANKIFGTFIPVKILLTRTQSTSSPSMVVNLELVPRSRWPMVFLLVRLFLPPQLS